MCQGGGSVDEVQGLTTGGTFCTQFWSFRAAELPMELGQRVSQLPSQDTGEASRSFLSTGEAHVLNHLNPLFTPSKTERPCHGRFLFFFLFVCCKALLRNAAINDVAFGTLVI